MAGIFKFIGWGIIIIGFTAAFFSAALGATILGAFTGFAIGLGSIITAAPILAIAEALDRLERLQVLQSRANETHEAILTALTRKADA